MKDDYGSLQAAKNPIMIKYLSLCKAQVFYKPLFYIVFGRVFADPYGQWKLLLIFC